MGSYAECWLENFYIGTTKDHFDYELMHLFRASDKKIGRLAVKDLLRPAGWAEHVNNPRQKINVVYYSSPASVVKDKLELKGYTLRTAKRAFMKRMRIQAKRYSKPPTGLETYYADRARVLKTVQIDSWLETLRQIKERGLGARSRRVPSFERISNLEEFMLAEDWYGFSGADLCVPLRLALEICDSTDNFTYDLTDLVDQGELEKNLDCVAVASEFVGTPKIIVLTEGRSDAWILSESMKLLYPHLRSQFSFMDFDAARVEGGASHLVRIVRSFAGAGIVNRAVAVFDNDAVGQEAIRSLRGTLLPPSLSVLKLPDLTYLRKYPTVGPSGRKTMDVNGSAACIELYLGDDVLRENGKLPLIHWGAYSQSAGIYQGSLSDTDKGRIQRQFKEKLSRQKGRPDPIEDQNWLGLRAILSCILSAFHRFDEKAIALSGLEKYSRY